MNDLDDVRSDLVRFVFDDRRVGPVINVQFQKLAYIIEMQTLRKVSMTQKFQT